MSKDNGSEDGRTGFIWSIRQWLKGNDHSNNVDGPALPPTKDNGQNHQRIKHSTKPEILEGMEPLTDDASESFYQPVSRNIKYLQSHQLGTDPVVTHIQNVDDTPSGLIAREVQTIMLSASEEHIPEVKTIRLKCSECDRFEHKDLSSRCHENGCHCALCKIHTYFYTDPITQKTVPYCRKHYLKRVRSINIWELEDHERQSK